MIATFVLRPVATTLLAIGVMLSGLIALVVIPVAPLPQVDFPMISVSASLPGASPETMASAVATPLERALGTISGVSEIISSNTEGRTRITVQFDLSKNIDNAAREVQAAIQAARTMMPSGLPDNPTYRKANPSDTPILIIGLTSRTLTPGQIYDAAASTLAQNLAQIEGVGNVDVRGSALPAVRIEMDLAKMSQRGLGLEDLRLAVVNANPNRPKGSIDGPTKHWQIASDAPPKAAEDFRPLIVAERNGSPIRLSEVASVEDSVQDTRNFGTLNGQPAILLIVTRQPGANILEAVDRVRKILPALQRDLPPGIEMRVVMERTASIRGALRELGVSLGLSIALVILVTALFLQQWRATLIPAVAVPLSLAGTVAIMYLAGYSLNTLSLMALVIATGFVVDDAIVVMENIARHVEEGMRPLAAAVQGAREMGFTVLAMSLSLVAVFVPVIFMGDIVGRFLHEFAMTLTAAIGVSLLVSLTVTPMMSGRFLALKRERGADLSPAESSARASSDPPRLSLLSRFGAATLRFYQRTLSWVLRHPIFTILTLVLTIGLNVWLYIIVPKGFVPQQDVGVLVGFVRGDESLSFSAMRGKVTDFVSIIKEDPAVQDVSAFTGGGTRNRGFMFVVLKPINERRKLSMPSSAQDVVNRLRPKLSGIPGARLNVFAGQDVRIGGRPSEGSYAYTLVSDDLSALRAWEPKVREALSKIPELVDMDTDVEDRSVNVKLTIDRETAARYGIPVRLLTATLNNAYGQRPISTLYQPLNQYRVVLEAAPEWSKSPVQLDQLWVVGSQGQKVPLSALATWAPEPAPLSVVHTNGFASSTFSFSLAPGVSLSQATERIDQVLAELQVPNQVRGGFEGTAAAFKKSGGSQGVLFLGAILAIYLVLGILYESYLHPITILSTLPSAGLGALLALLAFNTEFGVVSMIGVILLIGIVKKNAILMIDVALHLKRQQVLDTREAIYQACLLRLRPIMMTSFAAFFGALPLALGSGDGAELRQPLGIAVLGGLLVSQILTLYTTPVVFLLLDRMRDKLTGAWRRKAKTLAVAGAVGVVSSGCASFTPGSATPVPTTPTVPSVWHQSPIKEAHATPHDTVPWIQVERLDGQANTPAVGLEQLAEPALLSLMQTLERDNATLAQAVARHRQTRATLALIRAAERPVLNASAGVSRGDAGGAASPTRSESLGLSTSWEVDLWGRLSDNTQASALQSQAAAADLAGVQLSLKADLAQTWFNLRAALAQLSLLATTVNQYERYRTLTAHRVEAGVASPADLAQAESQLQNAQLQWLEAGLKVKQLRHGLALLVGKSPAELPEDALTPSAAPIALPTIPVSSPSTLLLRRPDIAALQDRVSAANLIVGVAKKAFYPSLSLTGSLMQRGGPLIALFSAPASVWSIGAAIAAPLLDGGRRDADHESAIAAWELVGAQYRQTVLTAFREVEDSLAAARSYEAATPVSAKAVDAARNAARIVEARYQAGTASSLDVIVALAQKLSAERAELDLQAKRANSAVELIRALGGGWSAPAPSE